MGGRAETLPWFRPTLLRTSNEGAEPVKARNSSGRGVREGTIALSWQARPNTLPEATELGALLIRQTSAESAATLSTPARLLVGLCRAQS